MNISRNFFKTLLTSWRVIRVPMFVFTSIGILVVIVYAIAAIPEIEEQERTDEVVAYIQAQEITLSDVYGENLPPVPDVELVDATIEGVDANENGIRDDVELAIFEMYPDDPIVRSAMLQYALGMQMELTQVFNSETWVAAIKESDRGYGCLFATSPDVNTNNTQEEINAAFDVGDKRIREVENLVYNTDLRLERKNEVLEYIVSHGESDKVSDCDIQPQNLGSME